MLGTKTASNFQRYRLPRHSAEGLQDSFVELSFNAGDSVCQAKLLNFSKRGLAFEFDENADLLKNRGNEIESLRLKILNQVFFEGPVEVKHSRLLEGKCIVGVFTSDKSIPVEEIIGMQIGHQIIREKNWYSDSDLDVKIIDEYRLLVTQFRDYMAKVKEALDKTEKELAAYPPSEAEKIGLSILRTLEKSFKQQSDEYYKKISDICGVIDESKLNAYKRYFQFHLLDLIAICPFAKRCVEKPLGYSGDYEVMNMIYGNHYIGTSLYAKLQNRYCCTYSPAQANIERLNFLKNKIEEIVQKAIKEQRKAKITSLGSGPAKEILDFIETNSLSDQCIFTCVDMEPKALEYAQQSLLEAAHKYGRVVKINFVLANVVSYLRSTPPTFMFEQDLIYASGLFDYLKEPVSQKLVQCIFPLVSEGGELFIVNASTTNPSKIGIEFAAEWYLNHRTKEEMVRLLAEIGVKDIKEMSIFLDKEKVYWFLLVKKRDKC